MDNDGTSFEYLELPDVVQLEKTHIGVTLRSMRGPDPHFTAEGVFSLFDAPSQTFIVNYAASQYNLRIDMDQKSIGSSTFRTKVTPEIYTARLWGWLHPLVLGRHPPTSGLSPRPRHGNAPCHHSTCAPHFQIPV